MDKEVDIFTLTRLIQIRRPEFISNLVTSPDKNVNPDIPTNILQSYLAIISGAFISGGVSVLLRRRR